MNKKILDILEFNRIQQTLQSYIVTAVGFDMVAQLKPVSDALTMQTALDETADGVTILRLKGGIPVPMLENIRPALKRVDIGAVLNGQELAGLSRILSTVAAVDRFLVDLQDNVDLRQVYQLQDQLTAVPALAKALRTAVDEDGRILDDASAHLRGVRQQIKRLENDIRKRLEGYTRGNSAKYLSDPIVTIRDDRYVIPVRAEYRNQFGGVVHDQSATGQTLFIEPQAVLDMNNQLREAQIEENTEINRILAELSNQVAPYTSELADNANILGHFDFINAKAKYAQQMKATEPLISDSNFVNLNDARHPLLDPKQVVANTITIGEKYQAIVVTGPNTGGKTITLKTLGLIQLMAQSGLFIPATEESTVGIFSQVFADIGDEQSIEQNLSTFSSHMQNITQILADLDDKSLVLFDELGAGTDPQEGAALAIAILDQVGAIGAYVVASTHYPELKLYGYNTPGTINASMEFDVTTLQPTYRLLIGVPGRSNAFDISLRLGLNPDIVNRAKLLISDDSHELNNMISDLENQRNAAESEYRDLTKQLADAQKLHQELQTAYTTLQEERDKQVAQAKRQANQIVENAEVKADKIIKDLRQMQLDNAGSIKENQLIDAKTGLRQLRQEEAPLKKNKVLKREKAKQSFKVGDEVMVTSYGQKGTLLEQLDKTHWQVQLGILKMKVATTDLQKAQVEKSQPKRRVATVRGGMNSGPSTTLDLRGQRYDEAMDNLDSYIDAALLAGYPQITIVHGLGTGAIRNGVTQYLKRNRQVKKFGFAPQNSGGSGATIVEFK